MANPVVFFEVLGRDGNALERFYRELFGWQTQPVDGPTDYRTVEPDGDGGIPGGLGATADGSDGHVTFYVHVDDLDATLKRMQELGGQLQMGPINVPNGGKIALFTDPEGHTIGLFKR